MTCTRIGPGCRASATPRKPQAASDSRSCSSAVAPRSSGSASATNDANATTSASEPRADNAVATSSLDLDRLDAIADLHAHHDVHAGRDEPEVGVLVVQELGILFHDEPLGVVVDRGVLAPRDPDRAEDEREVVVLRGRLAAARPVAERVPALHDPVLDPVEREVVVEARAGLLREARDGLRGLVGAERERERAALRELDGRLVRGWAGCWARARRLRGGTSCGRRAPAARDG